MAIREPSWWYQTGGNWQAISLSPIAAIYGAVAVRRFNAARPFRAARPVICVGNFTAGGTGKTPLSVSLAEMLRAAGREPWFLSRGYTGRLAGPVRVNPAEHNAADVGDEPLLLAASAPTIVSRDRIAGAKLIGSSAPQNAVVIMDDGLQNPAIAKDLTIAVIDAKRGDGNGRVIPSGPLRAPLDFQFGLADAILINGGDVRGGSARLRAELDSFARPILRATARAVGDTAWLKDCRVVAYAGIANPGRFFDLLAAHGATLTATRSFADHAPYDDDRAAALLNLAAAHKAQLVTTEKDFVRLTDSMGRLGDLKQATRALAIALVFEADDRQRLANLLAARLN